MNLKNRLSELKIILAIDQKKERILEIKKEMNAPDFWLKTINTTIKSKELKNLEEEVKKFDDIYEISKIASEEDLLSLKRDIDDLEMRALFIGKYDAHNAILNFYAGAGGIDAQDWTEMLLKMYLRWAENNESIVTILDQSPGSEAGIKSATVLISGKNIYGKLRGESGVHRLVRLSPFNAKNLRQTSFALVDVIPEIEEETEVLIDSKDLRIDVFRSGGAGGQSVNKTSTAIRVHHIPTGITVSCQNERSQLQNREMAMKILRSRLAALMLKEHKEKVEEIRGDFSSPEWGNQIRSYVLHPYKLVKDHRTELESKNPDNVLSGEINDFIEAELKKVKP